MHPVDVKEVAHEFMGMAKENLKRDGHLLPVAALVEPDGLRIIGLDFGPGQKRLAYNEVAKIAKANHAAAVLLINDCHFKTFDGDSAAAKKLADNYKPGQLEREGAPECLVLVVLSKGAQPWMLLCPYKRIPKPDSQVPEFEFSPCEEHAGTTESPMEVNMFKFDDEPSGPVC